MRVCILGTSLSSLTLAKSLVNQKIYVDVLYFKKRFLVNKTRTIGISKSNVEFFKEKISTYIPCLTNVCASVKLINPFPNIQTFIIILILTTKIR